MAQKGQAGLALIAAAVAFRWGHNFRHFVHAICSPLGRYRA